MAAVIPGVITHRPPAPSVVDLSSPRTPAPAPHQPQLHMVCGYSNVQTVMSESAGQVQDCQTRVGEKLFIPFHLSRLPPMVSSTIVSIPSPPPPFGTPSSIPFTSLPPFPPSRHVSTPPLQNLLPLDSPPSTLHHPIAPRNPNPRLYSALGRPPDVKVSIPM
uniref:Uncharacterized protein n=1 Tax=Callorhinchus milii TaxID=7868 RepID=A0A4W3GJK6_CALMI